MIKTIAALLVGSLGCSASSELDAPPTLEIKLHASFEVACIGGSTTITLRSSKARINGNLALAVSGGKLTSSLSAVSVALDGFSIDIGGVPGAIDSLIRSEARKAAERALAKVIADRMPPLANAQLAGLTTRPFAAEILGRPTRFTVAPTQVNLSADGLFVATDTKLLVTGGEGGMFVSQAAPISSAAIPSSGLGIAIASDTVNQLFAGLWATGTLEQTVTLADVEVLAALLDDDARSLAITLSLPPTISSTGTELALAIGDMMISVRDSADVEIQRVAVSIRATLSLVPNQSGTTSLTVGAPQVYAQVLAQTGAIDRPMSDEQMEGLVTGVWSLLSSKADGALSMLPIPSLAGIRFGTPSIEGLDGYIMTGIPVE